MKPCILLLIGYMTMGCEGFSAAPSKSALGTTAGAGGQDETALAANGGALGEAAGEGSEPPLGDGGMPDAGSPGAGGWDDPPTTDGQGGQATVGQGGMPSAGAPAAAAGAGQAGLPGTAGAPQGCQGATMVDYTLAVPNVFFLIDSSATMADPMTTGSNLIRSDVVQSTLMTPGTGLIPRYQGKVAMGLALFANQDSNACPTVASAPFALNNFVSIGDTYGTMSPGGYAPAAEAIEALAPVLAAAPGTRTLVLLLSQDPTLCSTNWDAADDIVRAANDLELAYQNGTTTYLVKVGYGVSDTAAKFIGNTGQGVDRNTSQDLSYQATDGGQLNDALEDILSKQASCTIELAREVTSSGSDGVVKVDGVSSFFGSGWQLTSSKEMKFLGASCDQLKVAVEHTIEISFPCGSVE